MAAFLEWLNEPSDTSEFIRATLAHLWFVTIHPFDDGNGRLARAIADMCLARADNTPQRFYSMSAQIHRERNAYYRILEHTHKEGTNITSWMSWSRSRFYAGSTMDGSVQSDPQPGCWPAKAGLADNWLAAARRPL